MTPCAPPPSSGQPRLGPWPRYFCGQTRCSPMSAARTGKQCVTVTRGTYSTTKDTNSIFSAIMNPPNTFPDESDSGRMRQALEPLRPVPDHGCLLDAGRGGRRPDGHSRPGTSSRLARTSAMIRGWRKLPTGHGQPTIAPRQTCQNKAATSPAVGGRARTQSREEGSPLRRRPPLPGEHAGTAPCQAQSWPEQCGVPLSSQADSAFGAPGQLGSVDRGLGAGNQSRRGGHALPHGSNGQARGEST